MSPIAEAMSGVELAGVLGSIPTGVLGRVTGWRRLTTKAKSVVIEVQGTRGAVILKTTVVAHLRREQLVYEEVLPHLGLTGPRVLDWIEHDDRAWLVLDLVDGANPDLQDPAHRLALTRWAARLHAGSRVCSLALPSPLAFTASPEQQVRATEDSVRGRMLDPRKGAALLAACERLRACLPAVMAAAEALPPAFAHLDLAEQNLRLGPAGLVALDWERSGVTSPAVDLANVDPAVYASELRRLGDPVSLLAIERGAAAGRVLADLLHDLPAKPMGTQKRYLRRMLANSSVLTTEGARA